MKEFNKSYRSFLLVLLIIFSIPFVISFLVVAKALPRDWKALEEGNLKLAK